MITDLGTRKGAKISQVGDNSLWSQGLPWMRGMSDNFPIRSYQEIKLSDTEKENAFKERVTIELENESSYLTARHVPKEVGERYRFSSYLINPNKYRFRAVIRILSLVFIFIKKLNEKCSKNRTLNFLKNRYFFEVQDVLVGSKGQYVVYGSSNKSEQVAPNRKVTVVHIEEDILNAARSYFFRKAACEIKQFIEPRKYEKKSDWKD